MVSHYVYVMKEGHGKKSPVKIGVAVDVDARREELQIGNSRKLIVVIRLGPMTKEVAFELEASMHRRFKPQHIRGEWFQGHIVKWLTEKPPAYRQQHQELSGPMFENRGL